MQNRAIILGLHTHDLTKSLIIIISFSYFSLSNAEDNRTELEYTIVIAADARRHAIWSATASYECWRLVVSML